VRKLLVLAVMLAAGVTSAVLATTAPSATRVKIGDNYFVRASGVPTVRVAKGTRVKWVWTGRRLHNVKVIKGPARFASDAQTSGTYVKRVKRAGTYTIICSIHGAGDQKMKLIVG
jgi:plastocyanin